MTVCVQCGADYSDELEACPACGASAEVTCGRCETQYVPDGDACPACGNLAVDGVACETHPDRQAGARCVVCGRALCKDCERGDGAAALCEEHGSIPVIEGWAQVYSANEIEARLLRENLVSEGIDAQIYSQRDRAFSIDVGELNVVRVLVPVWRYAEALQVIRAHLDASGEVSFACPSCGEPFEPGQAECTACGAALV